MLHTELGALLLSLYEPRLSEELLNWVLLIPHTGLHIVFKLFFFFMKNKLCIVTVEHPVHTVGLKVFRKSLGEL